MDDFNNNFDTGVAPELKDDAKPEMPKEESAPQDNIFASFEENTQTKEQRFGTAPGGANNFGAPNQGSQNYYNTAPSYSTPNNNWNSNPYQNMNGNFAPQNNQGFNYQQKPNKPPKKNNTGKIVFAVLICICLVVSSLAIGSALTKNNMGTNNTAAEATDSAKSGKVNTDGDAAEADVENSPSSLKEYSGEGAMTAEQVYEAVKDINVGVIVYSNNEKAGEGSGIIVGTDSTKTYTYVLTAAHVISTTGYSVQVMFNDEKEIDAEIVGYDTKTDVGVLRIKGSGYPAAKFGDSSSLAVGQTVYAIGNPGGSEFFGTFTNGTVTALDRPVSTSSSSAYDLPCIQHNAAINPGNSGGALVNEYGQVIGLNSSKIADTEYEGMGFSVPINTVLEIYNDIVAHGYVTNRPMLGITYYAVSSDYTYSAIAWKNNLPYGSIVIANIAQSSDFVNKDVQAGDLIIAVNGQKLDSTDILLEAIEDGKVGDTLTLTICRLNNNGSVNSTFKVKVKLVEDTGDNVVYQEQQEATTEDINSYFPFGY